MNYINYGSMRAVVALLMIVALTACRNNDLPTDNLGSSSQKPIKLRLMMPDSDPQSGTKVDYEDIDGSALGTLGGKLVWQDGDGLTVEYRGTGGTSTVLFSLDAGGAGSNVATFSGVPPKSDGTGKYYLSYAPVNYVAPLTDDEISAHPNAKQQQAANNSTSHLRQHIRLAAPDATSITDLNGIASTPITLELKTTIIKIRLRHLPADLGVMNSIRLMMENVAGSSRQMTLDLVDAQADANGTFTAYVAIDPAVMSVCKGGRLNVSVGGAATGKSYTASLTSTNGKVYQSGKRYTITLGGKHINDFDPDWGDGCVAAWLPTGSEPVKASGLTPLDPNVFSTEHPVWHITGGGTAETDATVLANVRTALNSVSSANSIDLTLENVTTLPVKSSVGAFSGCWQLRSVSMPEVTVIGDKAFFRCTSLTTINFPKAISIGSQAFFECSSLTIADFPKATSVDYRSFAYCASLTSVNMPEVTTSKGSSWFMECRALVSASLPSVIECRETIFGNCSSLTTVNLSKSKIVSAFMITGCSSLKKLDLPSVTTIEVNAFSSCPLTELKLTAAGNITLNTESGKGTFGTFNPSECVLYLNKDKISGSAAPKANGNTWGTKQDDVPAVWKSIK